MPTPSEFVHLHFHSHYSLLDGATKVKGLGKHLNELEYDACALTDHGNLYGAIEFHDELKKSGIKPIIGMEAYVAKVNRFHRTYAKAGPNAYHTVLLCENKVGYQNLIKIASMGFRDGKYYGKPRIDHELLEKYNEGLIVLSACLGGELARRLLEGEKEDAIKTAEWYADVFKDRYYIELQSNKLEKQDIVNPQLIEIAESLNIPLVGTCDCHYLKKEHAEAQYILQLMGWQKKVTEPDVKQLEVSEMYVKSVDEIKDAFKNLPEACISNTRIIADRCELDLSTKKMYLPEYPVESKRALDEELIYQSQEGLIHRFKYLKKLYKWSEEEELKQKKIYEDRLVFELKVINDMKFPGYFLIVSDFIKWSKANDIPVGPGRGSGAGSLVAYVMEITDIDPLKYDLLFERFLNPDRVSMPDFDIDFEVEGRESVIDYVKSKYGKDNVCQISAIGSLKAKGAIKGVARVLDFPYSAAEKIAKMVPDDLGINLTKVMETQPEFRELAENGTEEEKKLINLAFQLEGTNNNLSTHAAGVIIMDSPVYDVMPTCTPTKGDGPQSMFTMKYAEAQGAVKFDFLGLRNLSIIDKTVKLINKKRPEDDQLDITLISMEDDKSFQLLTKGDTTGVFQLESEGMKKLIRKLKPDCFEDIIALVALYRPGPLGSGMVDDYVERKHGRQKTTYPHELMEPVLEETYGVMVYQEQVMRTVQVLAGFSLGGADILRRAIGKKKPEVLKEQRQKFVDGCKNNDIDEELSNYIFDLIDKFAGYGFNKSHSAAYALISYQTAWLKANYPVDFMAALLTIERTKPESVVKLINECREMNIAVLPPDINQSDLIFTAHGDQIRFGLNAIKNVGEAALESILQARDNNSGPFADLLDIFSHLDTGKVNSRVLEALIKSGVFDSIEPNRNRILQGIDQVINIANAEKSMNIKNQMSLFDFLDEGEMEKSRTKVELPDIPDWKTKLKLKFEKEALGFYISGHPVKPYVHELRSYVQLSRSNELREEGRTFKFREKAYLAGAIAAKVIRLTKKANKKMAILTLEDLWGTIEVLVFPKTFEAFQDLLNQEELDDPVFISGYINSSKEDSSVNIVADEIISLPLLRCENTKRMNIGLPAEADEKMLQTIKDKMDKYPGDCKINLNLETEENCRINIAIPQTVVVSEELINELEEILPVDNFSFQYAKAK